MDQKTRKLVEKRQRLVQKMAALTLVVQGTYLERFSTCARKNCACHKGNKHGPRAYVVVYRDAKQHQLYVPQGQLDVVKRGLRQHQNLLDLVRQISAVNLALMRAGVLHESLVPAAKEVAP